jgi:hypothetical protein
MSPNGEGDVQVQRDEMAEHGGNGFILAMNIADDGYPFAL